MTQPAQPAPQEIGYDDLTGSEEFRSSVMTITADEIVAFAAKYDPQPFHLDEAAGQKSLFGGLVSSGWMTAALTIRLVLEGEPRFIGGAIGLGIDSIVWPQPVRPGDQIYARSTLVSKRPSHSKPDHGIVKVKTETVNQRGEVVQVMVSNLLVRRR